MHPVVAAARLVRDATAGVVLRSDGSCESLPGLARHELLRPGSPVLCAGRDRVGEHRPFSSFLWPCGGSHASDGHVRVTSIAVPDDVPPGTTVVVVLSPATDLGGLTPRELEVLGLLTEGCSNQEIARVLVIAPRTVATHLEHVLTKLDAPTRTLAAVRAEHDGLLVPSACHAAAGSTGNGAHGEQAPGAVPGTAATDPVLGPGDPTGRPDTAGSADEEVPDSGRHPSTPLTDHLAPRTVATMAVSPTFEAVFRSSDASCVVDDRGEVVGVNDAWLAFAGTAESRHTGVGVNYVDVCRRGVEQAAPRAAEAYAALTAVSSGQATARSVIYPCAVPNELRWFRADFFAISRPGHVGVRHVDVTGQLAPLAGPGLDELLDDGARILSEEGLLVALDELLRRPSQPAVVVMVTDDGRQPRDAATHDRPIGDAALTGLLHSATKFAAVGRVSHDTLAIVVTADEPHTAMRAADAVIRSSSVVAPARTRPWGLAVRTAADDAPAVLARARRTLLRTVGDDRTGPPVEDEAERSRNLHHAAVALVDAVADYDEALTRGLPMVKLVEFDAIVRRSELACASAASAVV